MTLTDRPERENELDLVVEGMTCGSCAARVERTLNRQAGVRAAAVNFATGKAHVSRLEAEGKTAILVGWGETVAGVGLSSHRLPGGPTDGIEAKPTQTQRSGTEEECFSHPADSRRGTLGTVHRAETGEVSRSSRMAQGGRHHVDRVWLRALHHLPAQRLRHPRLWRPHLVPRGVRHRGERYLVARPVRPAGSTATTTLTAGSDPRSSPSGRGRLSTRCVALWSVGIGWIGELAGDLVAAADDPLTSDTTLPVERDVDEDPVAGEVQQEAVLVDGTDVIDIRSGVWFGVDEPVAVHDDRPRRGAGPWSAVGDLGEGELGYAAHALDECDQASRCAPAGRPSQCGLIAAAVFTRCRHGDG
ncbi:MAG: heavy-metal-associated domain-containing protein [Lysobacter sp.]|nr:heavy-metal-associated domain-containing protein [Lysobacter sp.]